MPLPAELTGLEVGRMLVTMGLNRHRQIGQFVIYVDQADSTRVALIQESWSMPTDDLIRTLEQNGIDASGLEEAYERLYRSG